jgi:hypothetical protein
MDCHLDFISIFEMGYVGVRNDDILSRLWATIDQKGIHFFASK